MSDTESNDQEILGGSESQRVGDCPMERRIAEALDSASHPRLVRLSKSLAAVTAMSAIAGAYGWNCSSVFEFKNSYRNSSSRGTNMRRVGKTEDGDDILQDRGGRKYVRNGKGTIRRFKG